MPDDLPALTPALEAELRAVCDRVHALGYHGKRELRDEIRPLLQRLQAERDKEIRDNDHMRQSYDFAIDSLQKQRSQLQAERDAALLEVERLTAIVDTHELSGRGFP